MMEQNEGKRQNAVDVKLDRSGDRRKVVKKVTHQSMDFVKDNKTKRKTWKITEYKDGSVGKQIEKIEVVK